MAEDIMRDFRQGVFDEVYLVYNKFLNAATQEVQTEKLLPITMPEKKEAEKSAIETDYIFEPNRTEILETLIPKSIKTQIYKAILDSVASEHGARMTAMHKATDNAQALKNDLVIFYQQKSTKAEETGKSSSIVVVAEGEKLGNIYDLARKTKDEFPEFDIRVSTLGHIQRGGSPSCADRVLASRLGYGAVVGLMQAQA
ncbi:hypothetical protein FQR65_LT18981 [Abscondita terminalis]|nr:hypothetical protein FQR65_LT18981 [Abscondita terminalis]